jgi:type VI secretion system secreted protein Hcp
VDRSSTNLMLALRSNETIKEAVLTIRKIGKDPLEYLFITINDGRVVGYEVEAGDPAGGTNMLERVAFSFNKIEVKYVPQGPDGLAQGTLSFQDQWSGTS